MTVFDWQSFIYPLLVVLFLMAASCSIIIYILIHRSPNILASAVRDVITASTFVVLTLVTGSNPVLNIDQFRPLIVQTRIALAVAMATYLFFQVRRIWEYYQ